MDIPTPEVLAEVLLKTRHDKIVSDRIDYTVDVITTWIAKKLVWDEPHNSVLVERQDCQFIEHCPEWQTIVEEKVRDVCKASGWAMTGSWKQSFDTYEFSYGLRKIEG